MTTDQKQQYIQPCEQLAQIQLIDTPAVLDLGCKEQQHYTIELSNVVRTPGLGFRLEILPSRYLEAVDVKSKEGKTSDNLLISFCVSQKYIPTEDCQEVILLLTIGEIETRTLSSTPIKLNGFIYNSNKIVINNQNNNQNNNKNESLENKKTPYSFAIINNKNYNFNNSIYNKTNATVAKQNSHDEKQQPLLGNQYINKVDVNNNTYLHYMISTKGYDNIDLYLKRKCNIEIKNNNGHTPIHFCSLYDAPLEVIDKLASVGANFLARDKRNCTILHLAVEKKQPKLIQYLLEKFSDLLLIQNSQGFYPFHFAAVQKDFSIFKIFVDHQLACLAENPKEPLFITKPDYSGMSCLHWAASFGNLECCKQLLHFGNINEVDYDNETPIFKAHKSPNHNVLSLLYFHPNIDLDVINQRGDTIKDIINRSGVPLIRPSQDIYDTPQWTFFLHQ
ncbi:hypothetical protein CYY_003257 [Polysphondylium violaceum]|uniref:Ankyrin repeat-containing protein n=1 Tax=Polysphondylium violaceum TaxID=133409 RepID=A0A8J4PWP2_9MYCE|nr:hypothetical protein CYY_003257 [Polysphondylium violaceum]